MELARLAQMIKQQENASTEMQKNLEEAVKRRNFLYATAHPGLSSQESQN